MILDPGILAVLAVVAHAIGMLLVAGSIFYSGIWLMKIHGSLEGLNARCNHISDHLEHLLKLILKGRS